MDKLVATARMYFIPLLVLGIAILTITGDPNERILKSVPIIPGEYRYEIAAGFAAIAALLAFIIYHYQKRRPPGPK
ncbi:hypothetical protein [Cognatiluteimonas telluris]|uniref:hypothetical protein n=1 Tax=Cognatiluteimonas telluris TaxID=1104775 RepID=UPI001407CF35|nr:hypothetical protein [Lysobacter telluris]